MQTTLRTNRNSKLKHVTGAMCGTKWLRPSGDQFGFASDWLSRRREFFNQSQSVVKQNQTNHSGLLSTEFGRSTSQLRARVKLESRVKFESTSNFFFFSFYIVICILLIFIFLFCFCIVICIFF